MLADGEVEVVKRGDDGQMHQLAVLGAGATLGESGITGIHGASATVRVTRPTRYLLIRGEAFSRLIEAHPRVAAKIAIAIARVENHRLHRMNVKVLDLLSQEPAMLVSSRSSRASASSSSPNWDFRRFRGVAAAAKAVTFPSFRVTVRPPS